MTEKEKKILTAFKEVIHKMSEDEKERLLTCGELIALIFKAKEQKEAG